MTPEEHAQFVREITEKNDLDVREMTPSDSDFVEGTLAALMSQNDKMCLLGTALAHWLIDDCLDKDDLTRLIVVAERLSKNMRDIPAGLLADVVTTAEMIRSVLFWYYVRSRRRDPSLIESSIDLLYSCLEVEPECLHSADKVLSHAYRVDLSQIKFPKQS